MGKALWLQLPRYRKKKAKPGAKRIPHRTKERAREERIYNARVKVWLVPNRFCLCCEVRPRVGVRFIHPATQCHHIRGRVGVLLLDERGWIPVCSDCHDWINNNPAKARKVRMLCEKGDWARPFPIDVKPENALVTAASLLEKTK